MWLWNLSSCAPAGAWGARVARREGSLPRFRAKIVQIFNWNEPQLNRAEITCRAKQAKTRCFFPQQNQSRRFLCVRLIRVRVRKYVRSYNGLIAPFVREDDCINVQITSTLLILINVGFLHVLYFVGLPLTLLSS